ncbi:MAG: beta-galactosidase [Victivallaceae bacterium]|nr:beta-galactosidase [Victivallaceae bacterium]
MAFAIGLAQYTSAGESFQKLMEGQPQGRDFLYSNRTDTPLPYPLAPRAVKKISATLKDGVIIAWRPPYDSRDIKGYRIFRDFKLVAECGRDARAWRDRKVEAGKTYRYIVRSVNQAGRLSATPGIYAYNGYQSTQPIAAWERILDKPFLSGVTVSFFWKDLEPVEGTFNWKYLDDLVAAAAKRGKTVGLWPYLPAPWLPEWMKGIATYDMDKTRTKTAIPYPLDRKLIEKYNQHLLAIAKRYNKNPAVSYILVTLSGSSGMHNNVQPEPRQFELLSRKFNYTIASHIEAWKTQFHFYEKNFPDLRWGYDIHFTNDEIGPALAVADWALRRYGSKVILFNEGMNGRPWMRVQWKLNGWQLNSEYIADQKNRTAIGYQMLGQSWSSAGLDRGNNGPLIEALKNADAMDADFLEIWTHDIAQAGYEATLDAAADQMGVIKVVMPEKTETK